MIQKIVLADKNVKVHVLYSLAVHIENDLLQYLHDLGLERHEKGQDFCSCSRIQLIIFFEFSGTFFRIIPKVKIFMTMAVSGWYSLMSSITL